MVHCLHGSANAIGGQCQAIKLKWGGYADDLKYAPAPPTIKFALGENVKQSNWGEQFTSRYPQTRMGVETIITDAFQAAREYEADWKKFRALKAADQARTVPPRRDLTLDALVEILNNQRIVHCHSYVATEVLMLMRVAEKFGFRIGTFTHILEGYKVADEMAKHGAAANSFADWWAFKFEVYDAIPQNPCLMQDRGVVVGIHSDSPETGRRLNQEAAKSMLYCGMSREDVIKMVTINPAIQMKVQDRTGSLTVGKEADVVVWNGDPTSIHSKPEQTWIGGARFFDLEQDQAMREADRKEKGALIQRALLSQDGGEHKPEFRRGEPRWNCEDVNDVWRQINSGGQN
jgi:imidazolonepropionase-like amidohydrolase